MKQLASVGLVYGLFLGLGLAFAQTSHEGVEKVEAAPTVVACCQNADDRAKVAAEKICSPAGVESLSIRECASKANQSVAEYFDCERTWQVVCAAPSENQTPPEESQACEGVTCSGHGTCVAVGDLAVCQCENGYGPSPSNSQECLPTEQFENKLEDFIEENSQ
jgi:hypothetical protein